MAPQVGGDAVGAQAARHGEAAGGNAQVIAVHVGQVGAAAGAQRCGRHVGRKPAGTVLVSEAISADDYAWTEI